VVKGDNLWDIAIANQMPLSQIIKYNPDLNPEKIWPGDEILFVPENPMLDVMVRLENKTFEPVEYRTEYVKDPTLLATQRIILKPGKEGVKRVTYDITMLNGYENEVIIDQETELIAPVSAKVKVGTKRTLTRISNSNFGVTSGRLSSNFGYRTHPISGKRTFHAGIDIAASTGTAVYAYSEGTVSAAGFNNTYGKYVIINHGGGLQTVYLHLSSINVDVGDKVATGKRIGNVGNTGYSTGSHLHFEVRVNGVAKSPWNYI
jgi:murein DD-endopeptidase MepM/ murein hydrolase activator NlpD